MASEAFGSSEEIGAGSARVGPDGARCPAGGAVAKTAFAALLLVATTAGAQDFGEIYPPQAPGDSGTPAFVEQLPEAALVPIAPAKPAQSSRSRKSAAKRTHSAKKATAVAGGASGKPSAPRSVFPSVEAGTSARVTLTAENMRFPSVGAGTIGMGSAAASSN